MLTNIRRITGVFLVVLLLGAAGCTQRVYYQARDGFKPDLLSCYRQTHTYQDTETGLQFSECHKQTFYKKTFPICPVSKDGLESEMICFTDCECEGVPTGMVEFTLLEAKSKSAECQVVPIYILGVAFGRIRTYELNEFPVTDTAWGYYSVFPGVMDELNSRGDMISVSVSEIERVKKVDGDPANPTLHFKKDERPIIFRYEKEGEEWVMRSVKTFGTHFLSGRKSLVFDVSDLLSEDVIRLSRVEESTDGSGRASL